GLNDLALKLMIDLDKNSSRLSFSHPTKGIMEYSEFHPKLSREIINKIDDILAEYYDFNSDEIDYILNYDIRFRMGDDEGEESNEE
ncbi:MAG: hypothetical protein PWQ59_1458, partial [Thermoanaerobacterium sp.]|nr:hypothetical protein [Thermoanaerobacterium sp.]